MNRAIDPAELYAKALAAANRREWSKAFALATEVLGHAPGQGGMHYVAGVACMELGRQAVAVKHLHRAVELDPKRANFWVMYAKARSLAGLPVLAVAEHALLLEPRDPSLLMTLGLAFAHAMAHERAVMLFRKVVDELPLHAPNRYFLAMSLVALGDIQGAERQMDACLELDPSFWKAYLSRSLLRKQTKADNHVQSLEEQLAKLKAARLSNDAALICIHMALAKERQDLGEHPAAFAHLVSAKSLAGNGRNYSTGRDERLFEALRQAFPEQSSTGIGCESGEPIFVVGMPRSGTTLVDRIISSHPDVHSAGELQNFPLAFKRASGGRTPDLLDPDTLEHAASIDWRRLGEEYIASTRPGTGSTPRFIDKLPHNFLYLGAIAKALPNARIICLRRNAMDTCLSNFRQLFAPTSAFHDYSYDLLDTGRYYVLFDRLMEHWKRALPGRILELEYEQLVGGQEWATRQLLDYCGLAWNEACLHFEQNAAPVATASSVQVREPIYRSSIQQWTVLASELTDLRSLLIAAGISIDP